MLKCLRLYCYDKFLKGGAERGLKISMGGAEKCRGGFSPHLSTSLLPAVRTIVNNWTSAGLLVSRAKDAINVEGLVSDLVKINQYRTLAANVEFLEGSACTTTKASGLLKNMQFDDDPCAIKDYINKRLSNSDLETIINCANLIPVHTMNGSLS